MGGVRQRIAVRPTAATVLLRHVVSQPAPREVDGSHILTEYYSDYAAKVFGFATFGRVYGAIICLSGVVNLSQPLLDALNHEYFQENPIPINVALASLGLVVGGILVTFVFVQTRKVQAEMDEMREANERDRLIPEVDEEDF